MKTNFSILLLFLSTASGRSDDKAAGTEKIQSFQVGGKMIALPSPSTELVEVGDEIRRKMEMIIDPSCRLVAAFVLKDEQSLLNNSTKGLRLTQYGMVQVQRHLEKADSSSTDFRTLKAAIEKEMGATGTLSQDFKDTEANFNQRIMEMNLDQVKLGEPVKLGCLLSKEDAYAVGMMISGSVGTTADTKIVTAIAFVRVKNRVLSFNLILQYKNKDTINTLLKMTEQWTEAVLEANKK